MPGVLRSRRRQPLDDEESLSDASQGSASKRARLNPEEDSMPLTKGYHDEPISSLQEDIQSDTSQRKHQPGSIVRVKLKNFVTYKEAEFFPGPSLNMVIGPNGTGKSTLVCAICLGLGWGTQHLGRAKDVSEFVKHGCEEALIEIELAANPRISPRNPIITCKITRDDNKTEYTINSKKVGKKEAVSFARKFSIQIDNLCQFLPQDKVVEFAAMTPVELLKSTQRAVATQSMIDMHEELKGFRKKQKDVQNHSAADEDTLKNLESRQQIQRADVARMREREELKTRLKFLEMARPLPRYREARVASQAAKEKMENLRKELSELQDEVEPSLRAVNEKQKYCKQIEMVVKERKQHVGQAEKEVEKIDSKLRSLKTQIEDLGRQKAAENKSGRDLKEDQKKIVQNIAQIQRQMEETLPEVDISSYNERIREKQRQLDEFQREGRQIQNTQQDRIARGKERQQRVENAKQKLANLDSQTGKMTHRLAKTSRDTAHAWEWIQRNQGQFEKPILGPPMVECNIKDPKYVDIIESLFQKTAFIAFTVQTNNDFKKLSALLHNKLHLSEVNIRTMTAGLGAFRAPVSEQELAQHGAAGWAVDFLNGPEPVLAMLCAELRLHQIAVFNRDIDDAQFEQLRRSAIESWATSRSIYKIVRRREYGEAATQTSVKDVRKAAVWTEQPVDLSEKHELQENIDGWSYEIDTWKKECDKGAERIQTIRTECRQLQDDQKMLTQEKSTHQKAISEIKGLPTRLSLQQGKLDAIKAAIQEKKSRIAEINTNENTISLSRGSAALQLVDCITTLQDLHSLLHEAEILHIEASSDVETLISRNSSVKDLLESKKREVATLTEEYLRVNKEAKVLCLEVKRLHQLKDDAFQNFMVEHNRLSVSEHEAEIEGAKASLELVDEGNGGQVIKEYEQRQKRIDHLKEKLGDCHHALEELGGKITELREKWEPELEELVGSISESFGYNMAQIGCAGEVAIFKDEDDFANWAIHILVKFRDNEPLTPLDSHRQSGGERAVSTIFYLMSLQSLTRSPFRVVDEINQGMDPRNERLVHKRMVGIACGEEDDAGIRAAAAAADDDDDGAPSAAGVAGASRQRNNSQREKRRGGRGNSSQYFLITPKLLPNLDYQRGMRVLCIASGEFMPEERALTDFRRCIDIKKGMMGGAGRGGSRGSVAVGAAG